MKILLGLFLCLIFAGAGFGQIPLASGLAFKLSIDTEKNIKDPQIREVLYDNLSEGIKAMYPDIYITNPKYEHAPYVFGVEVQVVQISASRTEPAVYALSTVVTKTETTMRYGGAGFQVNTLLGHNLVITDKKRLKETAIDLSAFIKSKIFIKTEDKK